ncbi:MAG: phospholipase D-like domain-containing protein [Gemmatimonadaceae bacterium]
MTPSDARVAPNWAEDADAVVVDRVDWLIDNVQTYGRLLDSLRRARRSVHIAQLAFDADCTVYADDSLPAFVSSDVVMAEVLIDLAREHRVEIRIVVNATWILNTARPLRRFFARRGIAREKIEVRGLSRFPHFMHAKVVIIDGQEAFLLGSPFVNSYWDNGSHIPFDARRPLRELGGRPLHDVSMRVSGSIVGDLERMFANLWRAADESESSDASPAPLRGGEDLALGGVAGTRLVCDAPDGIFPGVPDRAVRMLVELLAAIERARSLIYIEHQYLTSRPIVSALCEALRRASALEIIIVLNQNPDLTAYRGWQNAQLREHALLTHPRVGIFSLWSTDADPARASRARINQLFIHSKVIVVDDEWAAVGTSNLDGVSMGDYGSDFASALGRRVFRGVRNVEVNVVIDALAAEDRNGDDVNSIVALRERLWQEHFGIPRGEMSVRAHGGWLATWREVARSNAESLASLTTNCGATLTMVGRVLPYSDRAHPRDQLADAGIALDPARLTLCYDPSWFGVYASAHWIRNIFG